MNDIVKYPRTQHLSGSGLQKGDEDLDVVSFKDLSGKYIVVEEKIDGGNCGISFDKNANLLLQSRGHFLNGANDYPHFDLFKAWANFKLSELFDILGDQYIMYGEWMLALHSIYYDLLPHYFMEFDIYDKASKKFLSTKKRAEITKNVVYSVPVLYEGVFKNEKHLTGFIKRSLYVSDDASESLRQELTDKRIPDELASKILSLNDTISEGLYIKVEEGDFVIDRLKYVRPNFVQTIASSETHWLDRPMIQNKLAEGKNIYG